MSARRAGPRVRVALSTASTYPEPTATTFEMAERLGYDGVEVMVWTDPVSQDPEALRRLSDAYAMPVLAVHAPCLLVTQRVWGSDPWAKLERAQDAAEMLGAPTVVVHPPFRWQWDYARGFAAGLERLADRSDVVLAVENMFPWRAGNREIPAYAPHWDVAAGGYDHFTLDLSHTATSHSDALEMSDAMGERLAHLHLADGTGTGRDEHLVPGRGGQPCAEVLARLAARRFTGAVVVEVNTRRALDKDEREADLVESLAFARHHLSGVPASVPGQAPAADAS